MYRSSQLFHSVPFSCTIEKNSQIEKTFWIRLSGTFPEVLGGSSNFESIDYGPSETGNRIRAKRQPGTFDLHISQIEKRDTGVYYCFKVYLQQVRFLNGTFLQVSEPEPSVSVVSEVQPGQPVKFQCSVLSQSGNETCQDGYKLHWFRTGPDNIHPSFVSTHDECKKVNDKSTQNCIHTFSKNISSSDAGTYICAVATCGNIFTGNPIKVIIKDVSRSDSNIIIVLSAALVLSFIMSAFLVYKIRTKNCSCCKAGPQTPDERSSCIQQISKDSLVYSMPTFVSRKTGKARQKTAMAADEFSTYADVCCHDAAQNENVF
uniref:uncharacterized protein LOC131132250 isoform X2 n=1 Tax=Doryrhamphus excisus TaxID=161450 RepID=UPI0025AE5D25|nr:uncharacterized protein LOC131132250 isoform X2 [Doryrhamphus excisus]